MPFRTHSGTLIVAAPTRDGFVFCADRVAAVLDGSSQQFYQRTKIEVLDNQLVFEVAGHPILEQSGTCVYDVFAITRNYDDVLRFADVLFPATAAQTAHVGATFDAVHLTSHGAAWLALDGSAWL